MDFPEKIGHLKEELEELQAELDVNPADLFANVSGGRPVTFLGSGAVRRAELRDEYNAKRDELKKLYREAGLSEEEAGETTHREYPRLLI